MLKLKNILKKYNIILLAGLLLFLSGTFLQLQKYSNVYSQSAASDNFFYSPARIIIPGLNINQEITLGGIHNGEWILSDSTVNFLNTSGKLGEGYNTILYAHKRKGLFINLKNISNNDIIIVEDKNNKIYQYRVFSKEIIKPSEVNKLYTNIPNALTLFTCDGLFDQTRLLVKAKLI